MLAMVTNPGSSNVCRAQLSTFVRGPTHWSAARWTSEEIPLGFLIANITLKDPLDKSKKAEMTILAPKNGDLMKSILAMHREKCSLNDGTVTLTSNKNMSKEEIEERKQYRSFSQKGGYPGKYTKPY